MAKARKRYEVTGNVSINDKSMKGVVYQLVGMCNSAGDMKRPNGKPVFKKYRTHYLLQVNDKKDLTSRGLKVDTFHRRVVAPDSLSRFYTEIKEDSE